MRKVTFSPSTIEEWGYAHRRVGRPKDQWLYEAKNLVWKNADTWRTDRDTQSQTNKNKYKGKDLQETYIHTWAEDRHF